MVRYSAFLRRHGNFLWQFEAETFGLVSRPPRCRDLHHTGVIERILLAVEFGVFPHGNQFRCADGIFPGCILDVDRVSDRLFATTIRTNLSTAGNGHIVNLLSGGSISFQPAFDNLNAIQISAIRISKRCDKECWRLAFRSLSQIPSHRNAFFITDVRRLPRVGVFVHEIPATEEANHHPRTGRRVSFFPLHRIENCLARILGRPDRCITR